MRLTKHAHACVELVKDGPSIVFDPGTLTPGAKDAIARAGAVFITHEHFDHFDEALVAEALERQPELQVFGPSAVLEKLGDHGGRVRAVAAGDVIEAAGFRLTVHGERHASIHPDIPNVDNVGYLVDGSLFHPGDAYFAPDAPVSTLLLPTSGPWTKLGEAADFVRAVRPARVIQIHELMLSDLGRRSTATLLGEDGLTGVAVTEVPVGDSVELAG
ncbi:L-ascorbate metabolism protein UlaG, beta-lactamase superfamily [Amycolatopsis saalfeldensis]|uniref:L-ascorbate metabolism protein UlaG, beta-lactamase superfamily n=1 Tax=Amycolatopsis saalfeldensis TaxID=394193 RepID=A0A1H8YQJ9_9PSEU|nr:L-ascorbate metabolism protein UlaG, beta-lactamase superfamily [Amycolatopsis saalfeldensis]